MRGSAFRSRLIRRFVSVASSAGTLLLALGTAGAAETPAEALKECFAAKTCTAALVQSILDRELADSGVEARVLGLADQRFAITLSGTTGNAGDKAAIKKWVEDLSKNFQVRSTVKVDRGGKKTDLWFLTFRSQNLTAEAAAAASGDESDPLISALQAVYGENAIRRAGGNRLLLYGDEREIGEMKRFLALIDTPYHQVQLNIWAIQVTGSQACIAARTEAIRRRIRDTRDHILEIRELLRQTVRRNPATAPSPGTPCICIENKIERRFCHAGLDLDPRGNLSLNEVLLFLILDPKRDEKIASFLGAVETARGNWKDGRLSPDSACVDTRKPLGKGVDGKASAKTANSGPLFTRLTTQLAADRYDVDWHDFEQFGNALACFKDEAKAADRPDAPRRFAQTAAAVDGRLKAVMDAFAEDMGELLFEPLLADIQEMARTASGKGDPGITMVGQSRLVVTSAMKSALSAEMASFVESTRPKPFDMSLLTQAFPAARDADRGTLSGAAGVLSGLPQAQALLLAAALTSETEPTFTQVAPGISINARPTVFPDGGTARLLIEARFSNTTTVDTATDGNWVGPPPDRVASHTATTDAAVNPFDLLELSSFQQETSAPRSPYFVPILGRLPILGRAFQIPRKPKKTHHESLLLVNSVILPRSVELQRFYSRNVDPDFPLEGMICRDAVDVEGEIDRARRDDEKARKKCELFQGIKRALDSGR